MKDKLYQMIANLLPKRLVYFCAIRLFSYATTGRYSYQVVPELTAMDALIRWDDQSARESIKRLKDMVKNMTPKERCEAAKRIVEFCESDPNQIVNIDKHPIIKQTYDLCVAIEDLGANEDQTRLSVRVNALLDDLSEYVDKYRIVGKESA